jgi:hypothetical protein
MSVLDHAAGYPLAIEEKAAGPLAGGIANHGYQCGMLWGSVLAAGAQAYRLYGPGPEAEIAAVITAQKIVPAFRACNKNQEINCMEIIGMDIQEKMTLRKTLKFIATGKVGGMVGCLTTMAGKSSKAGFKVINDTLSENHTAAPASPVSCTALLAKRMGASEMHTVMAAGLAGGIGFSGGGCGALGMAIWLNEITNIKKEAGEKASNKIITARAGDIINKFLKASDYKFECAEITGQKFENIKEHADFLYSGGCSKIIDVLAAKE